MTREEAKQWLEAMKSSYALPIETYQAIDMAIEALSAEAVQGEWRIGKGTSMMCSVCGTLFNKRTDLFDFEEFANFCPYCGAKMTKGGDTE